LARILLKKGNRLMKTLTTYEYLMLKKQLQDTEIYIDPGEYDDVCRLRDEILIKENVSVDVATDKAEKILGVLHK
tara:strand:+ start:537 stop:761 length:225 start_codon:yes stop_codon:yes gene_type:complete